MDEEAKIKGNNIVATATTSCNLNIPQSVCVAIQGDAQDGILYAGESLARSFLSTTTSNGNPYILSTGGNFDNFKICDLIHEISPIDTTRINGPFGKNQGNYTKSEGEVTTIIPNVIKKVLLL